MYLGQRHPGLGGAATEPTKGGLDSSPHVRNGMTDTATTTTTVIYSRDHHRRRAGTQADEEEGQTLAKKRLDYIKYKYIYERYNGR